MELCANFMLHKAPLHRGFYFGVKFRFEVPIIFHLLSTICSFLFLILCDPY